MKEIITILGLLFPMLTLGQGSNDTIQIIAKLLKPGQGSKIHIAEYEVIKIVQGTVSNDTIKVGYYFYNESPSSSDTVLLNLTSYTGNKETADYYICHDYDAKKGIEEVKLSYVAFDYWKGCETGKGECIPLTFTRTQKSEKWYLIMPCCGSVMTVLLSKKPGVPREKKIIQEENIKYSDLFLVLRKVAR